LGLFWEKQICSSLFLLFLLAGVAVRFWAGTQCEPLG
jgi:hypothetical protein